MAAEPFRPQHEPLVAPGAVEHHVADLTVTASGDLTLEALQQRLAKHDQWLPIDGDPRLTLGDLIESNSTGPLRLGFGAWRDLLLGAQFRTKSGRLITAGGRTMKNVAGYDLTKCMVGQYGLLGSIVTVTMRTYRRPWGALLARFEPSEQLIGRVLPTTSRPQWAMFAERSLFFGYLGDEKTIAFYESDVRKLNPIEMKRQTVEQDIDFRARRWLPAERQPVRFRASVPPTRLLEFLKTVNLADLAADAAFGIVVGRCDEPQRASLCKAADGIGGRIAFEGDDRLSTYAGAELGLLRRIQSAFDA
jgi:hypothetical protein